MIDCVSIYPRTNAVTPFTATASCRMPFSKSPLPDNILQRLVKRAGKELQLVRGTVQTLLPEIHHLLTPHTQYRELQQLY